MTNYHNYQYSPHYPQYAPPLNQGPQMNPYQRLYHQQQQFYQSYYHAQQQQTAQMMQRAQNGLHHPNAPFQYSTSQWPTLSNVSQQQFQQGWKPMQPLPVTRISNESTVIQNMVRSRNLGQLQYTNDLKRKGVDSELAAHKKSRTLNSEVPTSSEPATSQFHSKPAQLHGSQSGAPSEAFTKFWDSVLQEDHSQPVEASFRGVSVRKTSAQPMDLVKNHKQFSTWTVGSSQDGWREFTVPKDVDPEITVLEFLKGTSSGASSKSKSTVVQPKASYSFLEPSQSSGASMNPRSTMAQSESFGTSSGAFNSSMNPGSSVVPPKSSYSFLEPSQLSGAELEASGPSGPLQSFEESSGASNSSMNNRVVYTLDGLQWEKAELHTQTTVPLQKAPEDSEDTVGAPRASQSYMYPEPVNAPEVGIAPKDSEITVAQLEAEGQDPTDIINQAKDDEWSFDTETDEEFMARFFLPVEK